MFETSVAAGVMQALFNFAVGKGADRSALARAAAFEPNEAGALDDRVGYERYVLLTRVAKKFTGDDALALHFGEEVDMSQFSVVGLLGPRPGSVRQVVDHFNRYTRLLIDVPGQPTNRFQLAQVGPALWLVDMRPNPNHFAELTESTFARMVCTARRMGVESPVAQVHVTHEKPRHASEYQRVFRVPVRFETQWNAIQLGEELLKRMRAAMEPSYVQQLAVGHAEVLLTRLDQERSIRGRIAATIAGSLENGGASVELVAKELQISRQTLYRWLKREGITFEELHDELRRKLALVQLSSGHSVANVAHQLGFSDRAAFSKAFKRWTGTSPAANRRLRMKE